jgi:hypothetical protein
VLALGTKGRSLWPLTLPGRLKPIAGNGLGILHRIILATRSDCLDGQSSQKKATTCGRFRWPKLSGCPEVVETRKE